MTDASSRSVERGRKVVSITVLVVCLFSVAGESARAQCEPANLISNCGFEVDTSGWGETNVDSLVRTTADAHGGVACGEADAVAGGEYNMTIFSCVSVGIEAGATYELSGHFKLASGADPTCTITALFVDAAGCSGFFVGSSGTTQGVVDALGWVRLEGEVVVPSGVESIAVLPSCNASGDFVVRLDDIVLVRSDRVFADGFETGDLSAWILIVED